ncbi:MAG: hemerythrin family protein [Gammaproteobacteria bacterium]|nr:hemerythrin family protein [Gammaproteobacteria bacterium]MCW8987930.1 hemerythrin family protein [Gammaproteobacteria bacterium]MCW9030305.1 hemerythrin family protein [Gammaproteobacteria bacterium]
MELIEWSDKFATGIPDIDSEHEGLIASINAFYLKQNENSNKDELVNILNNIYGSIHSHFMLEERLMQKNGYAEYEDHKDDHARLLDDLRDITTDLEHTSQLDEELLKAKLNDWFLIHFKTFDSRLHKLEQLIASNKKNQKGFFSRIKKLFSK